MIARVVAGALSLLAVGCIDRTPGLELTVERAEVAVVADGAAAEVTVDLSLRVHVGKHALAGRDLIVPTADLYEGGEIGATVNLARPPDFPASLDTGETASYDTVGVTPAGAFPNARAVLCGGEPVLVIVNWEAMIRTEDIAEPFRRELGRAEEMTTRVTCD